LADLRGRYGGAKILEGFDLRDDLDIEYSSGRLSLNLQNQADELQGIDPEVLI
jgi:hypothetical protein